MRKRLLAIIATVAMVVAMMPSMVFGLTADVTGTGTEADPYVVSPTNAEEFLNSEEAKGVTVKLSNGNYGELQFKSHKNHDNITIIGGDEVKVEHIRLDVHQSPSPKNLTIKNIKFVGKGVTSNNMDVEGWSIIGCTFVNDAQVALQNNVIKNLTIEDCTFDYTNATNSQLSAIISKHVDGLTIKNNEFIAVPYNAVQIPNSSTGKIEITGNEFESKNRVLKFNGNVTAEFDIQGNYFADPSTTSGKPDGNYIDCDKEISICMNVFETDPATDAILYFNDNVTIHELTAVPAKAATYHTEGNKAYWVCECSRFYADAEGEEEITDKASVVIPRLVKTEAPSKIDVKPAAKPEKSPNTGDNSMAPLAVAGLVLAAMAAIVATRRRTN